MFVVDTNVLVYAADASAPEHARCHALLERWRRQQGAWYLTWGNCYEFLRIVTHPRVLRRPWTSAAAGGFLASLQQAPGLAMLVPTERHGLVFEQVLAETPQITGNLWHDAETAVLMREHGIRRICTRDTDFARFPFVEIVDPLTSEP